MKNIKHIVIAILILVLLPLPFLLFGYIKFDLPSLIEEYYKSISGLLQTLFTFYIFTLLYKRILKQTNTDVYNNKSITLKASMKSILKELSSKKSIKNNNILSTDIYTFLFLIKDIKVNHQKDIKNKEIMILLFNFDENMEKNLLDIDTYIYSRKKAKKKDEIIDIVSNVIEFLSMTTGNKM